MSFLRKIRRRHKAFVLKRLAQSNGSDVAASLSSVEDGNDGDGDGDEDEYFIDESLRQAELQNVRVPNAASPRHETYKIPSPIAGYSVHKDVPGMNLVGKESRFWPRTAKTGAFLLVTAGAFFLGKLAAVGVTLTVASACKLVARGRIDRWESVISAGTGECYQGHESLPSSLELVSELSDESKIPFVSPLGNKNMDTNRHSQMDMEAIGRDQSEESLSIEANRDTLLAYRKQLKRLDCIKLPPLACPFIESMADSSCSSAKASPQTWFCNVGSSMAGAVASSAEMKKQGKFKSKVFLRRLRKGEPQSAPTSPSRSNQEAKHGFCILSDGNDTEGSQRDATGCRKSKFRPASPVAKEASRVSLRTGRMKQARETMSSDICISHLWKGEEKASALMPATPRSKESMVKMDIQAPSASTRELPHKRRGRHQCIWKQVTPASLDTVRANAFVSSDQDSLHDFVQRRGERQQQQERAGTSWIVSGLVITIVGLFMGRTVAIAGLVCYWYALSLKSRKASGRRR